MTLCHTPEDLNLQLNHCENLISHSTIVFVECGVSVQPAHDHIPEPDKSSLHLVTLNPFRIVATCTHTHTHTHTFNDRCYTWLGTVPVQFLPVMLQILYVFLGEVSYIYCRFTTYKPPNAMLLHCDFITSRHVCVCVLNNSTVSLSTSNRNEYQVYFLGVKAAGA